MDNKSCCRKNCEQCYVQKSRHKDQQKHEKKLKMDCKEYYGSSQRETRECMEHRKKLCTEDPKNYNGCQTRSEDLKAKTEDPYFSIKILSGLAVGIVLFSFLVKE